VSKKLKPLPEKMNNNDMADAEAICEALSRPNMRFVQHHLPEYERVKS
jgi:transposase